MYLSQLELVGFKSFAQKTTVKFKEGITAIVGPNGCGKTNIVDALRWVLGEQKTSTLRSDKMNDVIFNGTKKRKPLGMAEVALTIENTKGILPTEFSEVTITRRLFRNGDSRYLLNKTPCRLKDILNLFMDTGMGADAYSVIELKMIETILSDKAEERRRLFEEASGVTKYKIRRKETLRRMEALQGDLARARDIIAEVEKTVRSLARQASKAQKYKETTDSIAELERSILAMEYKRLTEQSTPLAEALKEQNSLKHTTERLFRERESSVAALETEQTSIEERLAIAERQLAEARAAVAAAEREKAVAQERFMSLTRNEERLRKEQQEQEDVLAGTERRIEQAGIKLTTLQEQRTGAEQEFTEQKKLTGEVARSFEEKKAVARDAQQAVLKAMNAISAAQADSSRAQARVENLRKRLEELTRKKAVAEQQATTAQERLQQEQHKRTTLQQAIATEEANLTKAQEEQQTLRTELEALRKKESDLKAEKSRTTATIEFLNGLAVAGESTRFLLGRKDWHEAAKPQLFADVINTEERFRTALAAALGSATEYFVVPNRTAAAAGIASLEQHKKGRATFICLDSLVPIQDSAPLPPDIQAIGKLADVVRAPEELQPAVRGLLGDTILTETLEQAWHIVSTGIASAAVTLAGEVARRPGLVRGGGSSKSDEAAIGKQERLRTLQTQADALEQEIRQVAENIKEITARYNNLDIRRFADAIRNAESALNTFEKTIAQIEFQRQSSVKETENLAKELLTLTAELAEADEAVAQQAPDISGLQEQKKLAEQALQQAQELLRTEEKRSQEAYAAAHAAEMRVVRLRAEEKALIEDEQRLRQQRENALRRRQTRAQELASTLQERQAIEKTLSAIHIRFTEVQTIEQQRNAERTSIAEEQLQLRRRIQSEAEELRTLRKQLDATTAEAHRLHISLNDIRSAIEHCRKRAIEEFETDIDALETLFHDSADIEAAKLRVKDLKSKLTSYGAVNLLAFEEHAKENERLTTLQTQLKDLEDSEQTLRNTIDEINETAQKMFLDTFYKVRDNFIRIFQSLFYEGDEADLALEEGDPLEAQVNITAKPRGKRPHSIEMLSGGEKTLTAIALLFAIYLVKPSPFCILDEVDAPLDDANIGRYVRLIREFSKNTQFIMITHNKNTMEAADSLYGVTMEEEGVSRLVSVLFQKEQAVASSQE